MLMKRAFSTRLRAVVLTFCVVFSLFAVYFFHQSVSLHPGEGAHDDKENHSERESFRNERNHFLTHFFQQQDQHPREIQNALQQQQQPIAMADVSQQLLQHASARDPAASIPSGPKVFAPVPGVPRGGLVGSVSPFGSASRPFLVDLVFVIGSGRSGTSMITRSLEIFDFYVPSTVKAAPMNAKGFWEDRELNAHNDALLVSLGYRNIGPITQLDGKPNIPQPFTDANLVWQSMEFLSSYIQIALHERLAASAAFTPFETPHGSSKGRLCLPSRNGDECVIARIGVKDPRISRLMPYWVFVLQQYGQQYSPFCLNSEIEDTPLCFQIRPRYVITYRNPIAFVQSVLSIFRKTMENDELGAIITMKHWLICYVTALYYTKSSERIFFNYEDYVNSPIDGLRRLAQFVGVDLAAFDQTNVQEFADSFVEKQMNHHKPSFTDLHQYEKRNQLNGYMTMYRALLEGESMISTLRLDKPPFDTSRLLLDFSAWNQTIPIPQESGNHPNENKFLIPPGDSSVATALGEVKKMLGGLLVKSDANTGIKVEKHLQRFEDVKTLIALLVEKASK